MTMTAMKPGNVEEIPLNHPSGNNIYEIESSFIRLKTEDCVALCYRLLLLN